MIKLESVTKKRKRVGRGISAGQGKTSGRGMKGQKSRSGFNIPNRFEGGQTPLSMRLPKLRGFKSKYTKAVIVSLDQISSNFKAGEEVSLKSLAEKEIVPKDCKKVKVLNNGKLTVMVKFGDDIKLSKSVKTPLKQAEKSIASVKDEVLASTSASQDKDVPAHTEIGKREKKPTVVIKPTAKKALTKKTPTKPEIK